MGTEEDRLVLVTVGELREIDQRLRRLELLLLGRPVSPGPEDEPEPDRKAME